MIKICRTVLSGAAAGRIREQTEGLVAGHRPPPAAGHRLLPQPPATLLLAREPVHVVSQRLGHASPMVTLTVYAHVMPGNQRETANTFARLVREARGA